MCLIEFFSKTGDNRTINSNKTTLEEYKLLEKHKNLKLKISPKYDKGYILVIDSSKYYETRKIYFDNEFAFWLAIMKSR